MSKQYHFITGLPRSGSTMLSAILRQNPRFHASITDPLATFVKGMLDTLGHEPGMNSEVPIERRQDTIKGMFDGFYQSVDRPVIFNTNRGWTYLTHIVDRIYPEARFIVCVRDVNEVINSFEQAFRKNPLNTSTVNGSVGKSVYQRADTHMSETGIIGFPYVGIKQAITGQEKNKIILVEYNDICKNPKATMQAIYNFINEPWYEHDFDDVEANWDSYDLEIGIKLHQVRKQVTYQKPTIVLPPDILQKYANMEVWRL